MSDLNSLLYSIAWQQCDVNFIIIITNNKYGSFLFDDELFQKLLHNSAKYSFELTENNSICKQTDSYFTIQAITDPKIGKKFIIKFDGCSEWT